MTRSSFGEIVSTTEFMRANPLVFVDVGALGGIDSRWKKLGSFLKVIAFDPQENPAAEYFRMEQGQIEVTCPTFSDQ